MNKFKSGDVVRLKKNFLLQHCGNFFRKGSTHTVVSSCGNLFDMQDKLGVNWTFLEEDAEHVLNSKTSNPKTAADLIDRFNEALRKRIETLYLDELMNPSPLELLFDKQNCSHSWKQYLGFNDSFEYCEHCDARKDGI